jgi:DNA-binding transcriptional LysR family regulator
MATAQLNALNAFVAVARRLSFSAAARALGVSASTLSESVRQLEKSVGAPLLKRSSRSVTLTEAGQRLLDEAGPAVEAALEALKGVSTGQRRTKGLLRLTAPGNAVEFLLAKLIPRFVARHPDVALQVMVENRVVNLVAEGYDAGMRLAETMDLDMTRVRLTGPGRLVVAGAPSYFNRKGTPLEPDDLLRHDCLCMRSSSGADAWVWELEQGQKVWRLPVRGPVETNDSSLMRALALAGVGLLYTAEASIADAVAQGRLRLVLEEFAPSVSGLFLCFPSRAQISQPLRAFIDVVRESLGEGAAASP